MGLVHVWSCCRQHREICYQPATSAGIPLYHRLQALSYLGIHLFSNETTCLFAHFDTPLRNYLASCSSKDHRCLGLLPFGCCFAPTFHRGATQVRYLMSISLNYALLPCPKPTLLSPTPSSRPQSIKFGTILVISLT